MFFFSIENVHVLYTINNLWIMNYIINNNNNPLGFLKFFQSAVFFLFYSNLCTWPFSQKFCFLFFLLLSCFLLTYDSFCHKKVQKLMAEELFIQWTDNLRASQFSYIFFCHETFYTKNKTKKVADIRYKALFLHLEDD